MTLCTSRFVDDVMFSCNEPAGEVTGTITASYRYRHNTCTKQTDAYIHTEQKIKDHRTAYGDHMRWQSCHWQAEMFADESRFCLCFTARALIARYMLSSRVCIICLYLSYAGLQLHCESKKQNTKLLAITSPNINRFSKLFHYQTQQEICNKDVFKYPTTSQTCRYTTL